MEKWDEELTAIGVIYQIKNNGYHYIIEGPNGYIDYWPTSAKWYCRKANYRGFGLKSLINYLCGAED